MDIVNDIYFVEFGHSATSSRECSGLGTLDEESTSQLEAEIRYFEYAVENNIINYKTHPAYLQSLKKEMVTMMKKSIRNVYLLKTQLSSVENEPKLFGKYLEHSDKVYIHTMQVKRKTVEQCIKRIDVLLECINDRIETIKYVKKFKL